ncbi:alpha/beta hydrolase [Klebsiella oxytoca]|uniref:alpha/beta hydrolase n=1 Tax=Klebsiella oxytoca TaxID=571 RepID=UPI0029307BC2|nr:alpha/beta hydrolase [Klebsiella oxytoca]
MSLLLLLKKFGPLPNSSVLLSPMLDFTLSAPSTIDNKELDPLIVFDDLLMTVKHYCSESERSVPLVSPLFGNLRELPPLLIQTGSDELLRDDAIRLSRLAQKAGVQVELQVWDGLWHVFQSSAGQVPEADLALQSIGKFINDRISFAETS